MKRLLWLHDDGEQISVRGPGPFMPRESLVEVELEEEEDEARDIIRKVAAAYEENDIPVPESVRDYLNQQGK